MQLRNTYEVASAGLTFTVIFAIPAGLLYIILHFAIKYW